MGKPLDKDINYRDIFVIGNANRKKILGLLPAAYRSKISHTFVDSGKSDLELFTEQKPTDLLLNLCVLSL